MEQRGENGREPEKKRSKKWISWIAIAAAAVVFIIALVNLIGIGSEDMQTTHVYSDLKEAAMPQTQAATDDPLTRTIDFEALKAVNDEIIGWIYIPNTSIDYPVLQGSDNDYYISHNARKEENRAGAIFTDYRNNADFSDRNTIIYGHRMNNGAMFADLHLFEEEDFYRENPNIYLYFPDGTAKQCRIFAAYVAGDTDMAYTLNFATQEDFEKYLKNMQARSPVDTGGVLAGEDKVITLSTCVQGQEDKRYIVQAVAVN